MNETELKPLMLGSLRGEAIAHRDLLQRLSGFLRAYFKGKLARIGRSGAEAEAEDLVQDTLMAIHMRRHTYDTEQPLAPWVYAIARYKLIDHLRHTRSSQADVPIEAADQVSADDNRVGIESTLDLQKLMAALPDKMRRMVQAVKLDGLTVTETAARFGLTESSVKVSVHRGLKALAARISRENSP